DLEFKSEFLLKENVLIDTFNSQNGSPLFSLEALDLIFREERFDSTQEVKISKEGLVITGTGLICNLKEATFRLEKDIRIEGSQFDFFRLSGETASLPGENSKKEKPDEAEALVLTARGPLDLVLTRSMSNRPSASDVLRTGSDEPQNRLKIEGDVTLVRKDLTFRCDALHMSFVETADQGFEIRSLKGLSRGGRTAIHIQDYPIFCNDFEYRVKKNKQTFLLRGEPEIHGVALPLFSTLSGEAQAPELLDLHCGDLLEIELMEPSVQASQKYDVALSGGVRIVRQETPDPPLIEADRLSFQAITPQRSESPDKPPDPGKTSPAGTINIQDFIAEGHVLGLIDTFDLACNRLTYQYSETPQGILNMLVLEDPEESRLSQNDFSLKSPFIEIAIRPEITEITSSETFKCNAVLEKLPPFTAFSLLPGEERDPGVEQRETEALPGTIAMEGRGDFRLLISEEAGKQRQNILINNSPGFRMNLFRGETPVLHIEGERSFSLVLLDGDLSRLHLDDGGKIDCPELGFSTTGQALYLERPSEETLRFVTEGKDQRAFVSLSQPDRKEACDVWARKIRIFTGADTRLLAKEEVLALVPAGLFTAPGEQGSADAGEGEIVPEIYRIETESLLLERPEASPHFTLTCSDSCTIVNEVSSLEAVCKQLFYHSGDKTLSLEGAEEGPARIRIRSTADPERYDSILSRKLEVDLLKGTAHIDEGGTVDLTHYDADGVPKGRISIHCENDIRLEENRLEFKGPLLLDYQALDRNDDRYLACKRLSIYFEKSPLLEKLTSMDLAAYKELVTGPIDPRAKPFPGNRVRRLKAVEDVTLRFQAYSVACARLTWELLNDDIRCEGMGKKVSISLQDQVSIRGGEVYMRPVNEEFTVISR
ncbi:MAG: LPS export ABC transporter periplasmic protein LptC, partial [Planctomycetes bacterium]|nr:LPS export ABC transporter periplasmic protein LptC [Planctomycetota bacterium]